MTEPSPKDEERAVEQANRLDKINKAGPTWKMLCEVFGNDCLWVRDRTFGLLTPGSINPDGTVYPKGEVIFKVCEERFSPEQNKKRLRIFNEMMRDRRLMQTEEIHRRDEETEHKIWVDSDGVKRVAPAEHEELQRKKDEARKKNG